MSCVRDRCAERRHVFVLIDPRGTEITEAYAYIEALAESGSAEAAVYFPPFEARRSAPAQ